ncbi:uncharacterized protein DFL_001933 [Arthrobotrys flagrans]|uniref:Uncharacterized protein n=1 Tax=Arthrobotrys flagrans TaxID=97331 RepID=A0A437A9X7_ARTFL|nr:hypothetical protein DFL_001933 [Arthrobotrys flagrans]
MASIEGDGRYSIPHLETTLEPVLPLVPRLGTNKKTESFSHPLSPIQLPVNPDLFSSTGDKTSRWFVWQQQYT